MNLRILDFLKRHNINMHKNRIISALSVIVLFCVTYFLILPAVAFNLDGNEIDLASTNPKYINSFKLYYSTDDKNYTEITDSTVVPGDASIKVRVDYDGVDINTLRTTANYKMKLDLPELFKDATAKDSILIGDEVVGTIEVDDDVALITIDSSWLDLIDYDETPNLHGDFYVTADVDLNEIVTPGSTVIKIGNVSKTISFDDDVLALYAPINIKKEKTNFTSDINSETNEREYFVYYRLKVSTSEYRVPDVKVYDEFENSEYVEEIILPDNAELVDGKIVWNIGDMSDNSEKTLEYKVKIKNEYFDEVGSSIKNIADVYSKDHKRKTDECNFLPQANVSIDKATSGYDRNTNTLSYTIKVKASENNDYPIENVKVNDVFKAGSLNAAATVVTYSDTYRGYFSYIGDIIKLNGNEVQSDDITWTKVNSKNVGFTINTGALEPGEEKTITYNIKLDKKLFVSYPSTNFALDNTAKVTGGENNHSLGSDQTSSRIYHNQWARKLLGEENIDEATLEFGNNKVYEIVSGRVSEINNPPQSFTVPEGSYLYNVIVNERGDFDVSSASLTDTLSTAYMQFQGYLRVDAYQMDDFKESNELNSNDAALKEIQNNYDPVSTAWVKIDGTSSFNFKPVDIFKDDPNITENKNCAYVLTYYAKPIVTSDKYLKLIVKNTFKVSGKIEDDLYTVSGVSVNTETTIVGTSNFKAEKFGLFQDSSASSYNNSSLYWLIKVDGDEVDNNKIIRSGMRVYDRTRNVSGQIKSHFRSNSLYGVFVGKISTDIRSVADIEGLISNGKLRSIDADKYEYGIYTWYSDGRTSVPVEDPDKYNISSSSAGDDELKIIFKDDVVIDKDESVYIFVRTEPKNTTVNVLSTNEVWTGSLDEGMSQNSTATLRILDKKHFYKQAAYTAVYDGETFNVLSSSGTVSSTYSGKPYIVVKDTDGDEYNEGFEGYPTGTYIGWFVRFNDKYNMEGDYRIVDQIPEGLTPEFVQYYRWSSIGTNPNRITSHQLDISELNRLYGGNFTEHITTLSGYGTNEKNAYSKVYWYLNESNKVVAEFGSFQGRFLNSSSPTSHFSIVIGTRVTDEDVIVNEVEKTFDNTATLYDSNNRKIEDSSDTVTINNKSLEKKGLYVAGGKYPFQIEVNTSSSDLIEGSDEITLIDELSESLILDTTSIKVKDMSTGKFIENFAASLDSENVLTLTLPDSKHLMITYETIVDAKPETIVTIRNVAHWEGKEAHEGTIVEEKEFSYSAGGTVGVDTTPTAKVIKVDKNHITITLNGAKFRLKEMKLSNGKLVDAGTVTLEGVTANGGSVTFGGKTSTTKLKYDTPYSIQEIESPKGYKLDSTIKYFIVAKGRLNDDGNVIYANFDEYPKDNLDIWYQDANYVYQMTNERGSLYVKKVFNFVKPFSGTYKFGIYEEKDGGGANIEKGPLSIQTIKYEVTDKVSNKTAKFEDLNIGEKYYVFELDSDNNPITNGESKILNKNLFEVTYSNVNGITINENIDTVVVTNTYLNPILPDTGGRGLLITYLLGLMTIIGNISYICIKRIKAI